MPTAITRLRYGAPAHVSMVGLAIFWVAATLGLAGVAGVPGGAAPSAIVGAAAAVIIALTAIVAIRAGVASALMRVGHGPVAVSIRDQARRMPVSRQCDPNAAGSPRPRAPGCCSLVG